MDKIFIRDLQIETIIGVLPEERTTKQPLIINLEIGTDIRKAAYHENLKDTIDYAAVVQHITEYIANSQFQLLEALAEKTAELILKEFQVPWLRLEIIKPQAVPLAKVGVILERKVIQT